MLYLIYITLAVVFTIRADQMAASDNTIKYGRSASVVSAIMARVALVVGAASNLGYQVLTKLAEVHKGKIYFTTEDETVGYNLMGSFKDSDAEIEYIQMDITYTNSIIKLRHHIQDLDERIDLLINTTDYIPEKKLKHFDRVRKTLSVNFYGYINFGKLLYPLLNENARVINVSGPAGLLATIESEEIRNRISDTTLDEDSLVAILQEYEEAARKGVEVTEGWGVNAHAVSKVALNAVTFLQHREWADKNIVINCVNPGTLSRKEGRKTSKVFKEGAKAILYLALEAPLTIKGNFVWSNYSVIDWNCDPYVEVTTV